MTYKGTILLKKDGLIIPEAIIRMHAAKATCFGAICSIAGSDDLMNERFTQPPPVESVMEVQNTYKGVDVLLYFGEHPTGAHDDDISPHGVLFNAKNELILGCLIEGDFPTMDQPGSNHSTAHHMVHKRIIPKFKDIMELTDGNFAKVIERLDNPHISSELLGHIPDDGRGTIVFIANDGNIVRLHKGYELAEQEWGWATRIGEAAAPPKKEEPAAPAPAKRKFGFSGQKSEDPITAENQPPENQAGVVKGEPVQKDEYEIIKVPPNLTIAQLRDWLNQHVGHVPKGNIRSLTQIKIPKTNKILAAKLEEAIEKAKEPDPPKGSVPAVKKVEELPDATLEILPVKIREALIDEISERASVVAAMKNTTIPDPKEIQAMNDPWPKVLEQLGLKPTDFDRVEVEDILYFDQKYLMFVPLLAINWRERALKAENALASMKSTKLVDEQKPTRKFGFQNQA